MSRVGGGIDAMKEDLLRIRRVGVSAREANKAFAIAFAAPWTLAEMPDAERGALLKIDGQHPGAIRAYAARVAPNPERSEDFAASVRAWTRGAVL